MTLEDSSGPTEKRAMETSGKMTIWGLVAGLGLILLFAGLGSGPNNKAGLIVFGALTFSAGITALLGLCWKPESTGVGYALLGFVVPGYSLPFFHLVRGQGREPEGRVQSPHPGTRGQGEERPAGANRPRQRLLGDGREELPDAEEPHRGPAHARGQRPEVRPVDDGQGHQGKGP